jgi:nucleotide-binding universal stress UspA family protein
MKILIALDASTHSERALEFVTRMRWPAGSRVLVLSVQPRVATSIAGAYEAGTLAVGVSEEERRQLEEMVTGAERKLREYGFPTEGRVVAGEPRETLIDVARAERADVIVVGSHGRTGLARLMLGSVSSHVVTHAPCSVLVVKDVGRTPVPGKEKNP